MNIVAYSFATKPDSLWEYFLKLCTYIQKKVLCVCVCVLLYQVFEIKGIQYSKNNWNSYIFLCLIVNIILFKQLDVETLFLVYSYINFSICNACNDNYNQDTGQFHHSKKLPCKSSLQLITLANTDLFSIIIKGVFFQDVI